MKTIIDRLEKIQLTFGVICLSTFLAAVLLQVATRYLRIPMIWTEEVANYSFIWTVFMGAAIMLRSKSHFRFTMLSQRLNGRKKALLELIINLMILIFAILILFYGIRVVRTFWNYRWIAIPRLKMGYVWLCLPISGATMAIYTMEHIYHDFLQLMGKEKVTVEDPVEDILSSVEEVNDLDLEGGK